MNKWDNNANAFTLIELLTVMSIIFIMAALLVGVTSVVSRNMTEAKTKARMEAMMMALQEYQQDRGYFPQLLGADNGWVHLNFDIAALPSAINYFKHTQTGRPYIEGFGTSVFAQTTTTFANANDYVDGWNRPFQYTTSATVALGAAADASERGYWLRSKGHDKKTYPVVDVTDNPANAANAADDINSWGKR